MSEKRKPLVTVMFRHQSGPNRKLEVFDGRQFPAHLFSDMAGDTLESTDGYYRLRIDGVWAPPNAKFLYSLDEVREVIPDLLKLKR